MTDVNKSLLLGVWRYLVPLPRRIWQGNVRKSAGAAARNVRSLSEDHHRVRDFVVREIPRYGAPLPPEMIADQLALSLKHVQSIVSELEKAKTFLFRNDAGAVAWAYPVTSDQTPHYVSFSTGERTNAA